MSNLANIVWVLPRPRVEVGESKTYPGAFPLHFEKRLYKFLQCPKLILHPFGGKAEIGLRVDLKRSVKPDIIADAHHLPFRDKIFDVVICDPPYSNEQNKELYGLNISLHFKLWGKEAYRVCKTYGTIVLYHVRWLPRPHKNVISLFRIIVLVSQHHLARVVSIYLKMEA